MSSCRNAESSRQVIPAFAAIHAAVADKDLNKPDQPSTGGRAACVQVIPEKGISLNRGCDEAVKFANES
jgi:hypothetical protein